MGTGGSKSQGSSGIDAKRLQQQAFGSVASGLCAAPRRAASRNAKAASVPVSPAASTSSTMGAVNQRTDSVRRPVPPPRRVGSVRGVAAYGYDRRDSGDTTSIDSIRSRSMINRGRQEEESESDDSSPSPPRTRGTGTASRMPSIANRSSGRPPVAPPGRTTAPAAAAGKGGRGGAHPKGTCDKCDGTHLTDDCPYYKKKKDDHPDAWRNFGRSTPLEMGKGGGNFKLKKARVVRQPGDGNCLFHSMAYVLPGSNANSLRRDIAAFIKVNQKLDIADSPLMDWIKWDSGQTVAQYASRMAVTGWGGGIEMAACSYLKKINVHVYERSTFGAYKRISCFDVDGARTTCHVLYCGGVHYDALLP